MSAFALGSSDCPVCYLGHDPAIHEATLSLRAWLRERVQLVTGEHAPEPEAPLRVVEPQPRIVTERPKKKPGRPRSENYQPRRGNGRGSGWNRNQNLTPEAVLSGYRRGLSTPEVARELGCRPQTVHTRMADWRRSSCQFRTADDELTTCPDCGGGKARHKRWCSICAAREKKRVGPRPTRRNAKPRPTPQGSSS